MKKFNENFTNYELFKLNSRAAIRHLKNWFKSDLINKFSLINKMSLINKIPIIPINFISKFNIFKFIKLLLKIMAYFNLLFGVGVVVAYNFNPVEVLPALSALYEDLYFNFYNFYQDSIRNIINQLTKLLNNESSSIADVEVENDDSTVYIINDLPKPSDPSNPGSNNFYFIFNPYFYVPVIKLKINPFTNK